MPSGASARAAGWNQKRGDDVTEVICAEPPASDQVASSRVGGLLALQVFASDRLRDSPDSEPLLFVSKTASVRPPRIGVRGRSAKTQGAAVSAGNSARASRREGCGANLRALRGTDA